MKVNKRLLGIWTTASLMMRNPAVLRTAKSNRLPIVVSLTSIPGRLKTVHLTIRSVLNQSTQPEKIVLWLQDGLQEQVPKSLSELVGEVFEIRYVPLGCSHRKLIHSLEAFPDKIIVTCDDDKMYGKYWLEKLYKSHKVSPADIIINIGRYISRYPDGTLAPYIRWSRERGLGVSDPALIMIGWGGVLYPPNSMPPETVCDELFLKLAPRADDLWFKAMAVLAKTNIRTSYYPPRSIREIRGTQVAALKHENMRQDMNRVQWNNCEQWLNIKVSGRTIQP